MQVGFSYCFEYFIVYIGIIYIYIYIYYHKYTYSYSKINKGGWYNFMVQRTSSTQTMAESEFLIRYRGSSINILWNT